MSREAERGDPVAGSFRQRIERIISLAAAGPRANEDLARERQSLVLALEVLATSEANQARLREQAEAGRDAARAALADYHRLLENGPDGYLVTDALGMIKEANAAVADLLHVPRRFLIGKPLSAFVAESDLRAFRWRLNNVKNQERGEWPLWLRPRQGEPFIAGLTLAALDTIGAASPDLRWFVRDISARQRVEELAAANEFTREILESEQRARAEGERVRQRLELLARLSGVLASSIDYPAALGDIAPVLLPAVSDLVLLDLQESGAFHPQLSAHSDSALEERLEGLRPASVELPPAHPIATVARTGQPMLVENVSEAWLDAFAGSPEAAAGWREIRLVSVAIVPIVSRRRQYGVMTFAFGLSERRYDALDLALLTDIGTRVALALDTSHLVRELETEHRRKDEFLAMLAHELRNPLGAVTNALAAMDQASPAERERLAEILGRQSWHLAHLVNDLLDVSRIRFGLVTLHRQRVDLREVVRSAMDVVRQRRESEGLSISARIAPEPAVVDGDPDRLEQVLGNLLDNALKYTPAGGAIDVSVGIESNAAVLHVRDSGVGIALEFQPRLFEVFSRSSIQDPQSRGGLGLGLSVVRELITQHGGTIGVESRGLGHGADFVIRLPLAFDRSPVLPSRPGAAREPFESRAILIVEDNDDARDSLRMLLEQRGHRVRVARYGREAIEDARAYPPDVALVDIGLPDMDGYAVARALRALAGRERIRLIALTGFSARHEPAAAGFDAYLVKPVDLDPLFAALEAGSAPTV